MVVEGPLPRLKLALADATSLLEALVLRGTHPLEGFELSIDLWHRGALLKFGLQPLELSLKLSDLLDELVALVDLLKTLLLQLTDDLAGCN